MVMVNRLSKRMHAISKRTNMAWLIETPVVPTHRRRNIKKNHGVNLDLALIRLLLHCWNSCVNGSSGYLFRVTFLQVLRVRPENVAFRFITCINCLSTVLAFVRHRHLGQRSISNGLKNVESLLLLLLCWGASSADEAFHESKNGWGSNKDAPLKIMDGLSGHAKAMVILTYLPRLHI